MRATTVQSPGAVKQEGQEVLQARSRDSPAAVGQPMVRQLCPAPREAHGGAETHLQPGEDPTPEQGDVPEGGCDPVGSPRGAGEECEESSP